MKEIMKRDGKPSEIRSNLGSAELILAQQIVIREMASLLRDIVGGNSRTFLYK